MTRGMTEVSCFILVRSHMLRKLATHYRRTFVGLWIQENVTQDDAWRFYLWLNNLLAIFFTAELYDVGQFNALTPERLTLGCLWPERLALPPETLSHVSFKAPQCLLSPASHTLD